MRFTSLAIVVLLLPATLTAQARDTSQVSQPSQLPAAVVREVVDTYNAPGTLRAIGSLEIAAGREIVGDVAVLEGPLTVAGRVEGDVIVVNGDLMLRSTTRIEGSVLVVGGAVVGQQDAYIGGDVRIYRELLHYREEGDRIAAVGGAGETSRWWARRRTRSRSRLHLFSASTYNRVEGLPIFVGPRIRHQTEWGEAQLELFGIVRTADDFAWDSDNLGHRVSFQLRRGTEQRNVTLGATMFDLVEGVERWNLGDTEVGLASFFLHRDYRDYYNRHGGEVFAAFTPTRNLELRAAYSDERWSSRDQRDPFTIFRNGARWRANPQVDDGAFHVARTQLHFDTRNDVDDPWSGWFMTAEYEFGSGHLTSRAPIEFEPRDIPADNSLRYHRGFLDFRRYNRVSPDGQLNFRLVLGGWLGGDELPAQRRFSVGGPGTLPGFDFRDVIDDEDVGVCALAGAIPEGTPAQCERMALAQAEYRGEIDIRLFDRNGDERRWYDVDVDLDADWILFLDAGRGWLIGPRSGELRYPSDAFPSLETFRTDVGLGLDLGILGVYVAKSLSHSSEPANFFVRVRHRF